MNHFSEITENEIIYNLINLKHLVFEVTDACNLRCKYCGYSDLYEGYDERENLKFSFQRAKLIIDYLYQYWEKSPFQGVKRPIVISFYGGEPLLNVPFIRDVIEYVESLPSVGRCFEYGMTTNAILLDRFMDFLVEKDFQLLISLDGNEQGQSYRVDGQGRNSFRRVYDNIKLLSDKYPDYYKLKVNFNSVIHDRNSVESTFEFIKQHFGKAPRLAALSARRIRKDKQAIFAKTYNSISHSLRQSKNCESLEEELFVSNPKTALLVDYVHKHSGNVFYNYSQLLIDKEHLAFHPTGTCVPFAKKMFITVKGRILQCEKIDHQFTLGSVTDNEVNLDIGEIAKIHNEYIFRYISQCNNCAINNSCERCVYQVDNIFQDNHRCDSFITEVNWKKRITKDLDYLNDHPELYGRILKEVSVGG